MINKIKEIIRGIKSVWRLIPNMGKVIIVCVVFATMVALTPSIPCSVNLEEQTPSDIAELVKSPKDYLRVVGCNIKEAINRVEKMTKMISDN